MTFVQRAHGRHETQRTVFSLRHASHLLHPRYRANDFHLRLATLKLAHGKKEPDRWKVALLRVDAASPQFARGDKCYGSRRAVTTAKGAASMPRLTSA